MGRKKGLLLFFGTVNHHNSVVMTEKGPPMAYQVNELIDKAIRNSAFGSDRDAFAHRVGMNHAALNAILTGSAELTPKMMKDWATMLGTTVEVLFA
jgi:plasmid maintenance system antidote protein VapI